MQIAIIGLGRMGSGVAGRLLRGGHEVHVYNRSREKAEALREHGAQVATDIPALVSALPSPRVLWLYLPSGAVIEEYLTVLTPFLNSGDTIIDGGNSEYRDSAARATYFATLGIHFIDVGTSGGIHGAEQGYCLMVGGEADVCTQLEPLFHSVAQKDGYARVGSNGAGHFTKMVHNAIEYGMMQAYAEGIDLLEARRSDLTISLTDTTNVWQQGSIIRSFLGELLAKGLAEDPTLPQYTDQVADTGEGRWAVEEGLRQSLPTPVFAAALYARYTSRGMGVLGRKALNLLRASFGGHSTQKI